MLRNYFKIALKVLARRKFFTFISLFAISFTLLVLLVATALLDNVFAPRAPEVAGRPHARRLPDDDEGAGEHLDLAGRLRLSRPLRAPDGEAPERRAGHDHDLAESVVSYLDGRKIQSSMRRTDGEFWRVLAFDFLEGEPFTTADDENGRRVAVISETTRQRFFAAGRRSARRWRRTARRFRVVGVVRTFPSSATPPRPISGCRSRPPSRAATRRSGPAISRP